MNVPRFLLGNRASGRAGVRREAMRWARQYKKTAQFPAIGDEVPAGPETPIHLDKYRDVDPSVVAVRLYSIAQFPEEDIIPELGMSSIYESPASDVVDAAEEVMLRFPWGALARCSETNPGTTPASIARRMRALAEHWPQLINYRYWWHTRPTPLEEIAGAVFQLPLRMWGGEGTVSPAVLNAAAQRLESLGEEEFLRHRSRELAAAVAEVSRKKGVEGVGQEDIDSWLTEQPDWKLAALLSAEENLYTAAANIVNRKRN